MASSNRRTSSHAQDPWVFEQPYNDDDVLNRRRPPPRVEFALYSSPSEPFDPRTHQYHSGNAGHSPQGHPHNSLHNAMQAEFSPRTPPRVSDPAVHDLGGPIELSPDSSPLEEPWSPSPLSSLGSRGSSYRYSPVSPLSVVSSLSPPSSPGYTSSHQRYARNDTYTHNRHYYSSDDEPMHDPSDEEPPQHTPSPQPSPPTCLRSPVQSMHTSPIQSPSRPSASRKSPTFSSRKKNSSPTPAVAASPQGPPRIRRRVQQVKSIAEIPEPDGFTCPVCKRPQANKRLPDLRRHIKTHFQVVKEEETGPAWICCGVPVAHAAEYGITDTSKAFRWAYDGEMMIRGCLQIFSRRDTYRRHLKDSAKNHPGVHCVGDPNADWVPGNKIASGTS